MSAAASHVDEDAYFDHSGLSPRELSQRLDQIGRLVRLAPRFTDAVRWWAGFRLQGERVAPSTDVELEEEDARLLDLPVGTSVVRREVQLVSTMVGTTFVAAAVTELVHEPGLWLNLADRRALRDGPEPTDLLAGDLHRAAWAVLRPHDEPRPGNVALRSRAILSGSGRPVALVTETVYWRLVTHRVPDATPHYTPCPTLLRAM